MDMAGVAGLPSDSNINGCDTKTDLKNPSRRLKNPRRCRTRKYPATPEQRGLIAMRGIVGADTPFGHRCSDLGLQLKNFATAAGGQKINLTKLMQQSHDDLSRMARQRE